MPEIQNQHEPSISAPREGQTPTHICEMQELNGWECMYARAYNSELWNSGVAETGFLVIAALCVTIWWRLRR